MSPKKKILASDLDKLLKYGDLEIIKNLLTTLMKKQDGGVRQLSKEFITIYYNSRTRIIVHFFVLDQHFQYIHRVIFCHVLYFIPFTKTVAMLLKARAFINKVLLF